MIQGSIFHTCTWEKNIKTPWCSVKTDENGTHVKGNWGDCGSDCPLGCQVKEIKSDEWKPCIFPFSIVGHSGKGHDKFFRSCTDVYPEKPDGRLMCSTKTNSSTNVHINGYGHWGICDEQHCPELKGIPSPMINLNDRLLLQFI